ncbi:hypothetical protein BD310DRAFT_928891 [Dichomitus squalens]|uniref:Uncharacterized protein n=1 Tax=Dichomitus squalens TaxID=114155 RepID=A0A4Q9PSZ3_9APHY|nr:hypothetical protein BD310DRAFT_928891 [Dichomitus squalens]
MHRYRRSLQVNHETRGHGVLRPRPVLASHGIFAVKLGPPAKGSWTLSCESVFMFK